MAKKTKIGSAKRKPWSGSWWSWNGSPNLYMKNGPLDKFDQYVQKASNENPGSRQWELDNHSTGAFGSGHCNGYSASSIVTCEPKASVTVHGITFTIGDLKGLLAAVYWWCPSKLQVVRKADQAHQFHMILLQRVHDLGQAIVIDTDPKPKPSIPWNHPAYKFEMTYEQDAQDPSKTDVKCKLWVVDYSSNPAYIGTKDHVENYEYWIKGNFNSPSKGGWISSNRPEFVWIPEYPNPSAKFLDPKAPNPILGYFYTHVEPLSKCPRVLIMAGINRPTTVLDRYPRINPLIFESLVALGPTGGTIEPKMATSWEVLDSGLTHIFSIREGVTFHDGTPSTAEDIVFSYQLRMNRDLGFPESEELRELIEGVQAVDANTVAFQLRRPMENFAAAHGRYWIVPQHVVEEVGLEEFAEHPIGCGPFVFESHQAGHYLTVVSFVEYYSGPPKLARITFLEVPDVDRRLELLREGMVDIAFFDYSLELERKAYELGFGLTHAFPAREPSWIEVQSVRVQCRVPDEFDAGRNAADWDLDHSVETQGPVPKGPAGPLRQRQTRRMPTSTTVATNERFPEWREMMWWQVQVQQRTQAAKAATPVWTAPFRLFFEILAEEAVDDRPCYRVRVTYPDRPRGADYQFADVWVSKEERIPVETILHVGDRATSTKYDLLVEILEAVSLFVPPEGMERSLLDPRWEGERVELRAFEERTSAGGSRLTSIDAPFPVRVDEPDLIVELQDWGG